MDVAVAPAVVVVVVDLPTAISVSRVVASAPLLHPAVDTAVDSTVVSHLYCGNCTWKLTSFQDTLVVPAVDTLAAWAAAEAMLLPAAGLTATPVASLPGGNFFIKTALR